jgi:hypothetical protein
MEVQILEEPSLVVEASAMITKNSDFQPVSPVINALSNLNGHYQEALRYINAQIS